MILEEVMQFELLGRGLLSRRRVTGEVPAVRRRIVVGRRTSRNYCGCASCFHFHFHPDQVQISRDARLLTPHASSTKIDVLFNV